MPDKKTKFVRALYIASGFAALILAYIGVIMPGIPGIPFILLTAFFFLRSSEKLYRKFLGRTILGRILRKFQEKEKVPLGFKLFVASQLWVSVSVAVFWLIEVLWLKILVVLLAVPVTVLIMRMKNKRLPDENFDNEDNKTDL